MATHSSIHVWEISWTEEPAWRAGVGTGGSYSPWSHKEWDTTEHTHTYHKCHHDDFWKWDSASCPQSLQEAAPWLLVAQDFVAKEMKVVDQFAIEIFLLDEQVRGFRIGFITSLDWGAWLVLGSHPQRPPQGRHLRFMVSLHLLAAGSAHMSSTWSHRPSGYF